MLTAHTNADASQPESAHRFAKPATQEDRVALFAKFAPLIQRLVRQYGFHPDIREELPGELYYRFHVFLDRYDPERGIPLRPYLVRQLSVTAFAFARKRWQCRQREVRIDIGNSGSMLPSHDPTAGWDARLEQRRIAADLPALIEKLAPRQREILIWRYYQGRSFDEIAQLLGVQSSTVRSQVRHAVNHLRDWLDVESQNGSSVGESRHRPLPARPETPKKRHAVLR